MRTPKRKFIFQLSTIIPFGKHKGKTIQQVAKIEPNYLLWMDNELDNFTCSLQVRVLIDKIEKNSSYDKMQDYFDSNWPEQW
jgi:hypothetical protein